MSRRTLLRTAVAAAMFAALLVPATPAAAGVPLHSLQTTAKGFTSNGVSYQLSISAIQYPEGNDWMKVTISKGSNPEGVAWARQEQSYSWMLTGNRFVPNASENRSTLKSATEMGDYGKVTLTLQKPSMPAYSCETSVRSWTGPLTGSVTLNTGTSLFGTITAVPTEATLSHTDGSQCTVDGTREDACPTPGISVSGGRSNAPSPQASTSVSAERPASTSLPASLRVQSTTPLPAARTSTPGSLERVVTTLAPREDVVIDSGLNAGTIRGEPGTWVSGTASWTYATAGYQEGSYTCGGSIQVATTSRPGWLSGTLAADMFTGPNVGVGQDLYTYATRRTVQAL